MSTDPAENAPRISYQPPWEVRRTKLSVRWIVLWIFGPLIIVNVVNLIIAYLTGGTLRTSTILILVHSIADPNSPKGDSWEPMADALRQFSAHDGESIYNALFFGQQIKFQYPPSSLLLLDLVHALGWNASVMNYVNIVCFLANASCVAILSVVALRRDRRFSATIAAKQFIHEERLIALAAFDAAVLFYPIVFAMYLGQIQIWIDLLFTCACLLWLLNHRALAGVCIGLACTIKPQFGFFLIWALFWREREFAVGLLVAVLPVMAISIWRYGLTNHQDYLNVLAFISQHGESYYPNNSVNGIVNRLLFNGPNLDFADHEFAPYNPVVYGLTTVAAMVFLLLALPVLRNVRRRATALDFGIAALCFTMGAPVAWEHHYGIMLPLYVMLLPLVLDRERGGPARRNRVLLFVSWCLSANPLIFLNVFSGTPLNILQAYLFVGGLLLLFVLFAESSGAARNARSMAPIAATRSPGATL